MIDIKTSLSENTNPSKLDDLLHEYIDQVVKEVLNKELKEYKVTVELDSYPSAMFSQLDSSFTKNHLYSLEAYGWINNDGVYVAEVALITSYDNKFKNGYTLIEFTRLKDYVSDKDGEEKDDTIVAQINQVSFAWKEVFDKILKKEDISYIVSYPLNK